MIGNRDELRVVLHLALVHQKIVIPAAALFARVVAAVGGSRLINCAAAFFGIEELADAAEVRVLLAPHDVLAPVSRAREFFLRLLKRHVVMLGETLHVRLVQRNQRVRTAITGAI